MLLSRPPETISMSVMGERARQVAGDWWTPENSAMGAAFDLATVLQATTLPLSNDAARMDGLTVLIFKSRRACVK